MGSGHPKEERTNVKSRQQTGSDVGGPRGEARFPHKGIEEAPVSNRFKVILKKSDVVGDASPCTCNTGSEQGAAPRSPQPLCHPSCCPPRVVPLSPHSQRGATRAAAQSTHAFGFSFSSVTPTASLKTIKRQ